MANQRRSRRPHLQVAAALVVAALTAALPACSKDGSKTHAPTTAARTAPGPASSEPSTTSTTTPGSTLAPGSVPDPCKGITQEQVSAAVGFTVEGEGIAADNGVGQLSCTYKAPYDDETNPGSSITISTEPATDSVDEIHEALQAMTPDAKPAKAEVGDGGWSVTGDGYSELRARIGGAQLTISIVSPSDKPIDLAAADRSLATLVITHFGMERPPPPPTTTTSTLAPIVPIPGVPQP